MAIFSILDVIGEVLSTEGASQKSDIGTKQIRGNKRNEKGKKKKATEEEKNNLKQNVEKWSNMMNVGKSDQQPKCVVIQTW